MVMLLYYAYCPTESWAGSVSASLGFHRDKQRIRCWCCDLVTSRNVDYFINPSLVFNPDKINSDEGRVVDVAD